MPFDLEAWTKELGLTPEEAAVVSPVFQKRLDKLEQSHLRQADFSRKMGELDTQRKALQDDIEKRVGALNADVTRLQTWEGEIKGLRKADAEAVEKAQTRIAALENKMRRLATEYGVPESELGLEAPAGGGSGAGAGAGAGNGNGNGGATVDPRYFTREDWEAASRDIRLFPQLAAEIEDVCEDVRELTGTRVRRGDLLREVNEANQKLAPNAPRISLRQFAEDRYKLADERKKAADKKQKDHDDRLIKETETRVRSEQGIVAPRPADTRRSPVLQHAAEKGKTATQQPDYKPQPSGVSRAVQAYSEGKYAVQ